MAETPRTGPSAYHRTITLADELLAFVDNFEKDYGLTLDAGDEGTLRHIARKLTELTPAPLPTDRSKPS